MKELFEEMFENIKLANEKKEIINKTTDDIHVISLSFPVRIHMHKGIEILAKEFEAEIKYRNRSSEMFPHEAYFSVDGIEFFELKEAGDEDYK
jgi:predicted enzyme involved in methoxymalonyl-ACP biosynthesis